MQVELQESRKAGELRAVSWWDSRTDHLSRDAKAPHLTSECLNNHSVRSEMRRNNHTA